MGGAYQNGQLTRNRCAAAKVLSTFLYGVTTHDALSFIVVPVVLAVVTAVACAVPARRAAKVDPLTVLRSASPACQAKARWRLTRAKAGRLQPSNAIRLKGSRSDHAAQRLQPSVRPPHGFWLPTIPNTWPPGATK
jgi:hypothetical protein